MQDQLDTQKCKDQMDSRISVGRRRTDSERPKINVQKQGDVIQSIQIQCSCGEQITIQCNYGDNT